MKLTGNRWSSFLKKPDPAVTAILLFGTEPGLVHVRANQIAEAWLAGNDDPFAVTRFSADDLRGQPHLIAETASQPSLLGGNRLVRLGDITDQHAGAIRTAVEDPARIAHLVVEAGNLTPRSKLRSLFESGTSTAACGCYPLEGRALADHVQSKLSGHNVTIDAEALALTAQRLSDNLGQVDQELDKLALLAGDGGRLDLELVSLGLGDSGETTLDVLLGAMCRGDVSGCERALARLGDAGQTAVGLLRTALRQAARLHQARCQLDAGAPPDMAIRGLVPPVMPRQKPEFLSNINRLDRSSLETMMNLLTQAERACKTGRSPDLAVAGQAFLASSRVAASRTKAR